MKKSVMIGVMLLLLGTCVSLSIAWASTARALRQPSQTAGVEMIELTPEELYRAYPPLH